MTDSRREMTDFGEPWGYCGDKRGGCKCLMFHSVPLDVHIGEVKDEKDPGCKLEGVPVFTTEKAKEVVRRIVACVNACKGLKTEDLELMAPMDLTILSTKEMKEIEAKLEAERTRSLALVEALERNSAEFASRGGEGQGHVCIWRTRAVALRDRSREAISKYQNQQPGSKESGA